MRRGRGSPRMLAREATEPTHHEWLRVRATQSSSLESCPELPLQGWQLGLCSQRHRV